MAVAVAVEVAVAVAVGVEVGVAVGDEVAVAVGVEVAVAVGVAVDVGVAVAVEPPLTWTTSCTLLDAASSELKSYPSLLALSIASERSDPDAATVEVRSTSSQTDFVVPGVNVVIVAPFGGRLLYVMAPSVQIVSATALILCAPAEPLVTHILSWAEETVCPASDCRSNLMYVSRTGEASDSRTVAEPKLLVGSSPAT